MSADTTGLGRACIAGFEFDSTSPSCQARQRAAGTSLAELTDLLVTAYRKARSS